MKVSRISIPSYLDQLEQEIKLPVTQERYTQLHQALDYTFERLQGVNASLKERVIELYGQLEENFAQEQLSQIQKTAQRLESLIKEYRGDHRPSVADRKKLRAVDDLLALQKKLVDHDPEESFALLDIARAVYNGDLALAKKWFLTLPEAVRDRFFVHMKELMAIPFTEKEPTIQALIVVSHELAGNQEPYPSTQEIDAFFLGISEEMTSDKIIDFNSLG